MIYLTLSLAVEASLIVFGGLRVPKDNAKLTSVNLVIPPILATWFAGYRGPSQFITLVI